MKTGPKPYKIKEWSFLDKDYSFDEILRITKDKLCSRGKITFKCKECGKIETIALDRFLKYNDVLCRICNSKLNVDYDEMIKQRTIHQKETIKEKYGVNNSWQCPKSTEKRIYATKTLESKKKKSETFKNHNKEFKENQRKKTEETIIKKYGSLEEFYKQKYEKYSETCLERYGVSNYRTLCRSKRIIFDNLSFDSSWELAFYLYYKSKNVEIKREPIKLEFEYNGVTHYCFPDFSVNDKLYEIKGNHFFDESKMINPYNRSQDDLYEAKHQCMLNNNVTFISLEDIKPMLNYLPENFKTKEIKLIIRNKL